MMSSLYSGFVLSVLAVRYALCGNPSHFKILRKFYMCFFMTIALPHSYVPICIFPPFLFLFYNFMNIIGVSDTEFIRLIAVRLLQHTNPVYISIWTFDMYEIMCDYLQSLLLYTHKVQLISIHLLYTYDKNLTQDLKYECRKRGRWSKSDVIRNDVILRDVIISWN